MRYLKCEYYNKISTTFFKVYNRPFSRLLQRNLEKERTETDEKNLPVTGGTVKWNKMCNYREREYGTSTSKERKPLIGRMFIARKHDLKRIYN